MQCLKQAFYSIFLTSSQQYNKMLILPSVVSLTSTLHCR